MSHLPPQTSSPSPLRPTLDPSTWELLVCNDADTTPLGTTRHNPARPKPRSTRGRNRAIRWRSAARRRLAWTTKIAREARAKDIKDNIKSHKEA